MAIDKRLNQIQTGTLTESRMNEDFVYWMKGTGLNILLVILLLGCGYMGLQWWWRTQSTERAEGWRRLEMATTPQDLAVVVTDHGKTDSIGLLARLRAADTYMESIVAGKRFDRDETTAASPEEIRLTPELRTQWLEDADRLYAEVAAQTAELANPALTPMAFHALVGRSAIAEVRGDAAGAKEFLEQASSRVGDSYKDLIAVATKRGELVEVVSRGLELPPSSALPTGSAGVPNDPIPGLSIPGVTLTPTTAPPGATGAMPTQRPPVAPSTAPTAPPVTAPPPAAPPAAAPSPAPPPSAPSPAPPPSAPASGEAPSQKP